MGTIEKPRIVANPEVEAVAIEDGSHDTTKSQLLVVHEIGYSQHRRDSELGRVGLGLL